MAARRTRRCAPARRATTTRHTRLGAWLAAVLLAAGPAAADMPVHSWMQLGGAASQIVLGTVEGVTAGDGPGAIVGHIRVDETLRGAAISEVAVAGNRRDASQPNFREGLRVVVFLADASPDEGPGRGPRGKARGREGRGDRDRRGRWKRGGGGGDEIREAIGGASGVLVVPERMVDATADFVRTLVAAEADLGWRDLEPAFFEAAPDVHPVLIAVSLEELRGRVGPEDEPDLMRAACNPTGVWRDPVHLWAMGMAGRMQLASTADCMRDKAQRSPDYGEQVAAAEALGDLGDPKSVDALIPLLLPPEDADAGSDDLAEVAALSLGKLGTADAVEPLLGMALDGTDDLGLHGTAVHALGLIGEGGDAATARMALRRIAREHPNRLVRQQARQTLRRLRGAR